MTFILQVSTVINVEFLIVSPVDCSGNPQSNSETNHLSFFWPNTYIYSKGISLYLSTFQPAQRKGEAIHD
jgi:hypothetical protein